MTSAGGPLGVAALVIGGLVRLAKTLRPHVAAMLGERPRLRTSRELAATHFHHRIEITPDRIVITPKDGSTRASSHRADVASLLPDTTRRAAIASKRKPS